MADVDIAPNFGAELKDGFKPVNAWVAGGIAWLDDLQQFYRERSAIEKEYSTKLNALAKKYYEKKAKKSSSLSVGDTPTMTPGSLESASLTTWTTQLTTLEGRAADHDRFGNELITLVAEPMRQAAVKYEDLRKSHTEYAAKLEKERDSSYGDLKKLKGKYDATCQEVENRRKKTESAFDYGKTKAQNAYQQQMLEMHNAKNTYLININITNKLKEFYYHVYVPEVIDGLQDLSETRVHKLNSLWTLATALETQTLNRGVDQLNHLSSEIPRNEPYLDSMMFVRHNTTNWQDPPDMFFEPSPVWHDDAAMCTDEQAKIFLRNILTKSKAQTKELKQDVEKKRREVEGAKAVRLRIRNGTDKRDEADVVRDLFRLQEDVHQSERKQLTAEVEVSTITSVVGDLSLGAKNHNFKTQTFKIPTNCDLCGERIWGLSAKGFDCRDCGYTCHSKCEMKVPATCPGEQSKEEKKKLKSERQEAASATPIYEGGTNGSSTDGPQLSRQDTLNSLSSGYAASAHRSVAGRAPEPAPTDNGDTAVKPSTTGTVRKNRIVAPPPAQYVSAPPVMDDDSSRSSEQRGKMLYAYDANGEGEISVSEGQDVSIVEADDGSGWTTIRARNSEGIVPTAYIELLPSTPAPTFTSSIPERPQSAYSNSSTSIAGSTAGSSIAAAKRKGPAVAPRRGAKKLAYVEALYEYEARSDVEWSMAEGDRFVLVKPDDGSGWAEVEKGGVVKSVPANYVQDVS